MLFGLAFALVILMPLLVYAYALCHHIAFPVPMGYISAHTAEYPIIRLMNQYAPWFMTNLECALSILQQLMLPTGCVHVRWQVMLAVIVVMQPGSVRTII